jgi:hypothetical protein
MADIATANITLKERVDDLVLWTCMVKGDGAGVTLNAGVSKVTAAWLQPIDETAELRISWATNIITYNAAPTNNLYHQLFVLGTM